MVTKYKNGGGYHEANSNRRPRGDVYKIYGRESLCPEPGCAFYIMWTAMNKNSPHPNAAKLWMEFTADDERQRFVTEVAGRYITSKNVRLTVPRPDLKFYKIDWQWIKVNKDDMSKRFIEEIQRGKLES